MLVSKKEKIALLLYRCGAVKFGDFILKSGQHSPIYIDLRVLVSYPKAMKKVSQCYVDLLKKLDYDRLAGIPYTALPITAIVSLMTNKPWIYPRKEIKDYGTKKNIEGLYHQGEKVVVIDDLITTGLSKLEVIKPLRKEGLNIKDVVVLIDRQQGGRQELRKLGYRLHAVLGLKEILTALKNKKKISQKKYQQILKFLK